MTRSGGQPRNDRRDHCGAESEPPVARWFRSMRRGALLLAACGSASSAPPPDVTEPHAPVVVPAPTKVSVPPVGNANATGRVAVARIVAAVDSGVASDKPVFARRDQHV